MKKEKVFYYSSTVENGKVIQHDGDPKHAVYKSDITRIQKRSSLYHKWIDKNYPNAWGAWGAMIPEVYTKTKDIRNQFMQGLKTK